jgi:hypothetical protein
MQATTTTTSAAQLAANRANAAHSTGPKSILGKSASSKNAIAHGVFAATLVVFHWESQQDFDDLRSDYLTRFLPIDRPERDLVDRLVDATWRRNRMLSIETTLLDLEISKMTEGVTVSYENNEDPLLRITLGFREKHGDRTWDTVQRYITATDRSYHRAMRELQTLQGPRFNDNRDGDKATTPPQQPQPQQPLEPVATPEPQQPAAPAASDEPIPAKSQQQQQQPQQTPSPINKIHVISERTQSSNPATSPDLEIPEIRASESNQDDKTQPGLHRS